MTRPANPPPIMRRPMVETIPLIVLLTLLTCAPNVPNEPRAAIDTIAQTVGASAPFGG